jgi:hypothetical protein
MRKENYLNESGCPSRNKSITSNRSNSEEINKREHYE